MVQEYFVSGFRIRTKFRSLQFSLCPETYSHTYCTCAWLHLYFVWICSTGVWRIILVTCTCIKFFGLVCTIIPFQLKRYNYVQHVHVYMNKPTCTSETWTALLALWIIGQIDEQKSLCVICIIMNIKKIDWTRPII